MKNQVTWRNVQYFIRHVDNMQGLKKREEPKPGDLYEYKIEMIKKVDFISLFLGNHTSTFAQGEEWISTNVLENVICI